MSRKRIVVTGAGGYIGRHVVKQLLDLNHHVIAIDINTKNVDARAEIMNYDIFNPSGNIFEELGKPDICLHLAWKDGFVHNSDAHIEFLPLHYKFINNLVDGGLRQIAVLGSMHEVGYHEGAIDENTPSRPRSLYGIAKNALRESLEVVNQSKNFKMQWLRAFYIYGDDLGNNSIFTKLLMSEKEGKEEFPFTSGLNKYDFINVDELALEISMSILQDEVLGTINCCIGKPVALKDKVEEFIQNNELKIKLKYGAYPDREYDSPVIYGNNAKIKTIINNAINNDIYGIKSKLESLSRKFGFSLS
ncbi:NAD-dependent epimerase/dehydratase family protein [Parasporobacterium paucivorans]|uniref:dTDP-6-deoxy-L-talose 4-dehydrogenase (NAD+) n=1 Tax=Parasporobacterium paucivorans DSM 15970 TaxID=1122934 RepID=A0A1M6JUX4_9FIRM|nr:NAD-dependent epimerase/dehydratase family protein [Parasporobacterium paucivorans]SHJ50476.1 dTDP-6-deoxy-L-talose 4-dehydrogenase (NAD+) [Parasporobacterium paucivorans DSM 15970]